MIATFLLRWGSGGSGHWGTGNPVKIPEPGCGKLKLQSSFNNGGSKGSLVRGEFSFLFDVADALNDISVGERRLKT